MCTAVIIDFKGELRDKNELIYNSSPISKLSVFSKLSYRTPTAKAGRKAVLVFRHLGKNTSRVTMVSSALWRKNVNGSRLVGEGFAGDS